MTGRASNPDPLATHASPDKPSQHTQPITVAMIIGDDHVVSPDAGRHLKHGDDGVDPLEPQFRDQPSLVSPNEDRFGAMGGDAIFPQSLRNSRSGGSMWGATMSTSAFGLNDCAERPR
jgi:hypothetical protein